MFLTQLVIEFSDSLPHILDVPGTPYDAAARVGCLRELLRDIQRSLAERCRIDPVICIRLRQIDLPAAIARRGPESGEVPGQHRRRRDK